MTRAPLVVCRFQALYEAGVCDGVILGNQRAMEQALHQQCGEVKSLAEWFACM